MPPEPENAEEPEVLEVPGEGPFVYSVKSRTRNVRHRVDLIAMNARSQCACEAWSFYKADAAARGEAIGSKAVMCHHIEVARAKAAADLCADPLRVLNAALIALARHERIGS